MHPKIIICPTHAVHKCECVIPCDLESFAVAGCVYQCFRMCLLLVRIAETTERQISIKANNFLHLQTDYLFQQQELVNQSHPRKVLFISVDNLFMNTNPVGYCPSITIQKHRAKTG